MARKWLLSPSDHRLVGLPDADTTRCRFNVELYKVTEGNAGTRVPSLTVPPDLRVVQVKCPSSLSANDHARCSSNQETADRCLLREEYLQPL